MPGKHPDNNIKSIESEQTTRTIASEPLFTQEITDHVNEDGSTLRSIVSRHSDGFVCLQLIDEAHKPKLPKTIRFGDPDADASPEEPLSF